VSFFFGSLGKISKDDEEDKKEQDVFKNQFKSTLERLKADINKLAADKNEDVQPMKGPLQ
jgi:hypothetical protein